MKLIFTAAMWLVCCTCYAKDYTKWLERCEPYRERVQSILIDNGVDPDYYYLMVAESRCTPKAESGKGAQGFWQLMPRTAKVYGCSNPHDLQCATFAAVAYLKRLESEFATFREVIYAYNMGGHNYAKSRKPTAEAVDLFYKVSKLKLLHSRI